MLIENEFYMKKESQKKDNDFIELDNFSKKVKIDFNFFFINIFWKDINKSLLCKI